ncbi:MAG: Com family DNA-binding transcriptional regulator [Kingella oralis]
MNTPNTRIELRCQSCQRKLGEIAGTYRLAVKCPRCKQFNHFQAA